MTQLVKERVCQTGFFDEPFFGLDFSVCKCRTHAVHRLKKKIGKRTKTTGDVVLKVKKEGQVRECAVSPGWHDGSR